jgi:hypothetical protein
MAIHFENPLATFIHIPKTGGSSFERWVYDNIEKFDRKEKHATLVQAKTFWEDLGFTFTFVRNPFARLVSMYHFIGQRAVEREHRRSEGIRVKKGCLREDDLQIINLYNKGFDYWINAWYENTPEFQDTPNGNWSRRDCQTFWVDEKIDLILKIENIKEEFNVIKELLNCKIDLPHVNKSNHTSYRDYYNLTSKKLVEELMKDDLEKFNYDF